MHIFQLVQMTFNNGRLGDFKLPRTLGYFRSETSAIRARDNHIASACAKRDADDHTTENDYRIFSLDVE